MGPVRLWDYTFTQDVPSRDQILERLKAHTGLDDIRIIVADSDADSNSIWCVVSHARSPHTFGFIISENGVQNETSMQPQTYLEGAFMEVMRKLGAKDRYEGETYIPKWAKEKWAELNWWERFRHPL